VAYRSSSVRARLFDDALREAMQTPITESCAVEVPPAADPAAGTVSPETDSAQVLRNRRIVDVDADGPYGHGVQHVTAYATAQDAVYVNGSPVTAEAQRQSRLRLWQAQR